MPTSLPAASVANEVRAAMSRRRMSQMQLAEALGRSQAFVSRRLTGEIAFDINELATIAEALDVPITALLGDAA
jgi:transcriptional regulator with XRE-family HTH domain